MEEENKGVGRPTKYHEKFNELARMRCLLGCTDKELAEFFDIAESTLNLWKNEYPEFMESISLGKEIADIEVANALFLGTKDRIVVEQQAIKIKIGQHVEKVEIVEVEKVIPADFRNQQFWLKNRKSDKWRDKHEVEHSGEVKQIFKIGDQEIEL